MKIGELAHAVGVTVPTIHYYEGIGVLPPATRSANGYRSYGEVDVERLRFVHRARALDFSLDEIREILALREEGKAPCAFVIGQIDVKLAEVERKIEALIRLQSELRQLKATATELPAAEIEAQSCVCHIIENQQLTR